jgi:geranylgeranyl pyrophosphate synthase
MHQPGGDPPGRGAPVLEGRRIANNSDYGIDARIFMFAHFHDYAENLKPSLDAACSGHLGRLLGDTGPHHSREELKLLTCGKKIRGSLLCMVTEILGGPLNEALPRAVAVELIQTATLIHDDFVDQHRVRRNLPALWTLEGARRAVLLGDVVFSSAIHMMCELGRDDCGIVSRAIAEISRGAYQEPLNPSSLLEEIATGRVTGTLYENIIYLKTGVLFGAACELGAVAAKADHSLQLAWRSYGLRIGEAYQIADDLQEIDQALLARSITAGEMTTIAPALLFFVRESRPHILEALQRDSLNLEGELLEQFQTAASLMKDEKERRLRAAVAAVETVFAEKDLDRLAFQAPWDLIGMFDAASATVSEPSRLTTSRK